jgi:hypothetical protein
MSDASGTDEGGIFYTVPEKGHIKGKENWDFAHPVKRRFLTVFGERITDPSPGGSYVAIYSRLNKDGSVDKSSKTLNTGNYLIIPANASLQGAAKAAEDVNTKMAANARAHPLEMGIPAGIKAMEQDFNPGGRLDWQRGVKWGIPPREVDPAFKDSTSYEFGIVTELTKLPNLFAEIGAGKLNISEYITNHGFGDKSHKLPYWKFGMDKADYLNFHAGVLASRAEEMAHIGRHIIGFHEIGPELSSPVAPVKHSAGGGAKPNEPAARGDEHPGEAAARKSSKAGHSENPDGATTAPFKANFLPSSYADLLEISHRVMQAADWLPVSLRAMADPGPPAWRSAAPIDRRQGGSKHFDRVEPRYHGTALPANNGQSGAWEGLAVNAVSNHEGLPSIAPIRRHSGRHAIAPERTPTQASGAGRIETSGYLAANALPQSPIDANQLRHALEDLLNSQARLPPSGGAAFDPRLTPAWPGLPLMA